MIRLSETRIRVYVVGLDALRATGLQAIFEKNTGIDILMEDISSLPRSHQGPDSTFNLAVVGANAGPDIFSAIAAIRSAHPELPIIVMSHASGQEAILRILMLGAKGFLHEASTPGQFEKAVRMVAAGALWAPRRVQADLIHRLLTALESQRAAQTNAVSFTSREQQVLNLLLDGNSNREIAKSLKIEERTVKSYVTKLMQKMGVKNRTALTMRAQDRSNSMLLATPLPLPGNPAPTQGSDPAIK
ncbi:MAG TPA: response regulator transcription factor [Acidobacteriaceae bacterium]|nr:response regulator transcription factor [Acidobacteriaceae bacterium]